MSEEELDGLLCMIYVEKNRERSFYERNADAIGMLEKRCLVTVGRDECWCIVSAEVTDIGKWFLMRGGFRQEARESRLAERERELTRNMRDIAESSYRVAFVAMIAAMISALSALGQWLLPHIYPCWFK